MAAGDEEQLEIKPQGGKKKLIIIIAAALVLLLAIGGGAAFFLLGHSKDEKSKDGGKTEEEKAAEAAAKMALYVVMPRPFVFNVEAKPRNHLVQIKVALLVRGPANEALAKLHSPLIEGALFGVFSAAPFEQLTKVDGRESLKKDGLAAAKQALRAVTEQDVIERVLFTDFVMQ